MVSYANYVVFTTTPKKGEDPMLHNFKTAAASMLKSTVSTSLIAVLLAAGHVAVSKAQQLSIEEVTLAPWSPSVPGVAEIPISGGVPPYSTSLNEGPFIVQPSNSYSNFNLAEGDYSLVIQDSATPTPNSITVDFNISPAPSVNPNAVQIVDIQLNKPTGLCDGQILVSALPAAGVSYLLTGGTIIQSNTTGIFTQLPVGTYTVTADNGILLSIATVPLSLFSTCTYSYGVQVGSPDCMGNHGFIQIQNPKIQGATGTPTFSYILDFGVPQSSPTFSPVAPGTHHIQVQATGCSVSHSQPVTLTTPTGPNACTASATVTATPDPVGCAGTISFTTTGFTQGSSATITNTTTGSSTVVTYNGSLGGSTSGGSGINDVCISDPTLPCGSTGKLADASEVVPTQIFISIPLTSGLTPTTTLDIKKCVSKKNGKIKPGKEATFKIVVTNTGTTNSATGVTVTDILPSNVAFVAGKSCEPWTFTAEGQTVTATLPTSLAPGASSTITLKVVGTKTVTNQATVAATLVAPVTATACARVG